MTRVDFYLLPGNTPQSRQLLACRLTEKAYRLGHSVFIHTESETQSRIMDDLLWTFRAGSFIPHARCGQALVAEAAVRVGHDSEAAEPCDVLINLAATAPASVENYRRVAELVDQDETIQASARRRYVAYKEKGFRLETHRLDTVQ